ncbi:MAG: holo-ACP synthase [Chitinophagaceae bacterium]|nr:holo-ACP synthase [Chitinophagaceae bacterium]
MIAGIGTDIVEIARIAEKLQRSEYFKTHVFSAEEIGYCEKQKNPAMHFAARWAVKEAYLKAYGLKFIGNHRLPEIETCHNEDGKPFIQLAGKALQEFKEKNFTHIHLSISHTEQHATAYVIIEK